MVAARETEVPAPRRPPPLSLADTADIGAHSATDKFSKETRINCSVKMLGSGRERLNLVEVKERSTFDKNLEIFIWLDQRILRKDGVHERL